MRNIIIVIVVGLTALFYFIFLTFTPVGIVENDSYAIPTSELAENLFKDDISKEEGNISAVKVQALDYLYSGHGKLFVGEEKKVSIDPTYPLFTNDNLAIVNLSQNSTLIDSNFKQYDGYPNFTLTAGELYNKDDKSRADNKKYLFLRLSNLLFLNSFDITINTDFKEYKVSMNSIINFNEASIKYYAFDDDILNYYKIEDIDNNTKITIDSKTYLYGDLLKNLGLTSDAGDKQAIIDNIDFDDEKETDTGAVQPTTGTSEEVKYEKPTVTCDEFIANVYSATSKLSISDPSGEITTPVIFEFKVNDKVYLRKAYLNSGSFEIVGLSPSTTFEVVGYYNYLTEDGKEVKQTIINQKLTTKGIDILTPISIAFNNGDIYPTKVEIKNFKITDGLDSETIKGVKKVTIDINGTSYKLSSSNINALLRGEEITYMSPENIQSNSIVNYKIIMSDSYGNELSVINNSGTSRTSKQIPKASVKVLRSDVSEVTLKVTLDNKDEVSLQNYRYVVVTSDNKIISQGAIPETGIIELNKLSSSQLYLINVYSDYDIEDGKGIQKDQVLGSTNFTSLPISSLGYVRLNVVLQDLLQNTVSLNLNIDTTSTNSRLIALLGKIKINIVKKNGEDEIVVFSKDIDGTDLEQMKTGQSILQSISNLESSTTYYIKIYSVISQGDEEYQYDTLINKKSFTTLKQDAQVQIRNSFSNENLIDFDVRINDDDGAILSDNVRLEVRDEANKIIRIETLNINDEYVRLTYDKLEANKYYTFNYIAEQYNVGNDNSTYIDNQVINSYQVYTETGIKGDIGLVSLLEEQLGKNLFDLNNLTRWKYNGTGNDEKSIDADSGEIRLTSYNGYKNYSYYLIDYASKKLTISFYAKITEGSAPVYIANSDGDATTYLLSNLSSEYKKYTYTFTLNGNGYVGFNIREIAGKNLRTSIVIKDLQIEEGTSATAYQSFITSSTYDGKISVNLNDTRNEIPTNDYFVNIYKEDSFVSTYGYNIDDTNTVIDKIDTYYLDKKATYRLDLVVKIMGREYVIDSVIFTTEKEIRSIRTVSDFFKMHNNGKYIVANDLDFRNIGSTYSATFYGDLDFQGKKVTIAAQNGPSQLISTIASTGVIKNIDLHLYLNNNVERSYYYGLNYYNYGTIENLMLTIEESTAVPNIIMGTVSYVNLGTITNFVINSKVSMNGERFFSPCVIHNYGTIKNGYIYGQDVNATYQNMTTERKRVGTIAAYTSNNSNIRNVFSLIGINSNEIASANNMQVGLLVGESNRGLIQNSYTTGEINITNTSGDSSVGYVSSMINTANVFYTSSKIYNGNYSQKVSALALKDSNFQDKAINTEDAFVIDGLVENGYYPHVDMPDCMPYQELITLQEVPNSDLIDITSTEVLESNVNSAKILFNINNPSAERISSIAIKDASVSIISQENSQGKTKLIGIVKDPIKYLSKYFVKSITSVGAFNIAYTREYANNERALYFDLYRPISTIKEWKTIKDSPSENYQLTANLDFRDATDYLVGNFSGKINGNGYTISNIEITSGNGLFTTLTGELKNLYVVNYKKINASSYGGLIYNSTNVSIIDNVHMTNVSINAASFVGGIIGYGSGTIIRNSSVTNFKNITGPGLTDIRIGAIAGYLSGGYIQNSFAQNVDIDIRDSISTYGIGGIVGQLDGGIVENCYATGNIKNNSSTTGGIVGLSSASISNVYSSVNIESDLDYVGGIAGQVTNNYLFNSLSVGSLYSSYITTNMHRTAGNAAPNQNNYALSSQLINGLESSDFYGESLLTYDELLLRSTYDTLVKLGEGFDYSGVSSGYLPKLYNIDGSSLLPNQVNNKLPQQQFKVLSIDKVKTMTNATILINFENPNNSEIVGIGFDYFKILSTNKLVTQNGITSIEVTVEPERYLDTYKLSKIIYKENGETKEFAKSIKIELQFYKNIGSFEDWQNIDSVVPENYRLVSDLDFTGKVNVNTGVKIARLEGIDSGYTIKNLVINSNSVSQSLIDVLTTNLSNVNFDNIKITNTRTSGNYNCIVKISYADINNVNLSNIIIDAPKMSYSAPIAISRGYHISNINLSNIDIKGTNYSAGFIGYAFANGYNDITGTLLTVVGQTYTGGIIGYVAYTDYPAYYSFNVTDSNITGTNYVGGAFGVGFADNSSIRNSNITGSSYVGGYTGSENSLNNRNVTVDGCIIKGTGTYIGGAFGYGSHIIYNAYVLNSTVTGTLATTKYVGGILGYATGWAIYDSGISDSSITSLGSYVGGIIGHQNSKSVHYSFVYNTTVSGDSGIGGVAGYVQNGNVGYVNVNAYITASSTNASGVFGYMANANSTNASNPCRIFYTMVMGGKITASANAGGLVGFSEAPLYSGHFYSDIVATTITTTNTFGYTSAAIGNNRDYNSLISNLLVYNNMKINGESVSSITGNGLSSINYVTLANLKIQSTYTNRGFSTSRYTFTTLASNKAPLVKMSTGAVATSQTAIDLPTEMVGTSLSLKAFEVRELPKTNVYSVGVDKINIEFSNVDCYSKIIINVNDKPIINQQIDSRVLTLSYDYKTQFEIVISDGINTAKETIKPENINRLISIHGDNYYYYKDGKIKGNWGNIEGEFVNLYLNYALDSQGNIYDLNSNKVIGNTSLIDVLDQAVPLYNFDYNSNKINTYYNYSEIIDKENNLSTFEDQYIVKNGQLEIISSYLTSNKDSLIIDSYGNKSYQSVLGDNGVLYNLKTPIRVPNDFINNKIKYFTNNINNNSGFILVYYEDGSIYGFDYRTGNRLFNEIYKENISVFDYIAGKLSLVDDVIDDNVTDEYTESQTLEKKLIDDPVNDFGKESSDKSTANKTYVSKYDPLTGKFMLYDEEEIFNNSDKELVSEYDKIISDVNMIQFYTGKKNVSSSFSLNGILVFISVFGAIVISLGLYFKNIYSFSKKNDELE